jgi:hypothetical protein
MLIFAGLVVSGSMSRISGLPGWLQATLVSLGFILIGAAYWRMAKTRDGADELTLLVRQRASEFTLCSLGVLWIGADLLSHIGYLSDFRWTSRQLLFLVIGLYIVGSFTASRRYV